MGNNNQSLPSDFGPGFLYAKLKSASLRPAWDIIQLLEIKKGERIVIFPGRNGDLALKLLEFLVEGEITIVEPNKELFILAKEKFSSFDFNQSNSFLFINKELSFMTSCGQYDVFISHFALPIDVGYENLARTIKSNLRPGGRFGLQLPVKEFCPILEKPFFEAIKAIIPSKDLSLIPKPEEKSVLIKEFRKAGFRELNTFEKTYIQNFDTVFGAIDFMFEYGGWGDLEDITLNENLRNKIVQEGGRHLASELKREKDIEVSFRRLIITGKR